ncbi:hypothetical protein B0H13DRAFT_2391670 [Mycena leptocephala]|nr:hypothetical protein B0H13DRAFT_2391670 [Mycena leptocephala]
MVDSLVPVYSDLVEGTDIMELLHNGLYQQLARLDSTCLDSIATGDDGRGARWLAPAAMEALSSSIYLEQQAELENSVTANAPTQAATSSSSVPSENNVTANAPTQAAMSSSSVPSAPTSRIVVQIIDKDRAPWIVPPSIQSVKQNAEKWTKWELDSFNGALAWILRRQKREIGADNEWYDREKKCRLFFGTFTIPFPGAGRGTRLPKEPIVLDVPSQGSDEVRRGNSATTPSFYGLPLLANVAEETSVSSGAKGKGKGKARRVYEDDNKDLGNTGWMSTSPTHGRLLPTSL